MGTQVGIWNQTTGNADPLISASRTASTQGTGTTGSGAASTISANDFLTLLVTEMKNQDPTASTDPNEYINQLVQVNSLEQLIDINQNLSAVLGNTSTGQSQRFEPSLQAGTEGPGSTTVIPSAVHTGSPGITAGNLTVPGAAPGAHRLAEALSGHL